VSYAAHRVGVGRIAVRYALIAVCALLLCGIGQGSRVAGEEDGASPAQLSPRGSDARFKERAAKRRKYIACYEAGKGECYKKYAESVKWCQENWEKCLPLMNGLGVHAGTYGKQVRDKCKARLQRRCREAAGL
jgi:hypothetical protein